MSDALTIPKQLDEAPLSGLTGKPRLRHRYYPAFERPIVLEVAAKGERLPKGYRGKLACGYGTSMYDFHVEVPIDGTGVRHGAVLVVELDEDGQERATPYLAWCQRLRLEVFCGRCNQDIVLQQHAVCPQRVRRQQRQLARRAAKARLVELRREWAQRPDTETPPLVDEPKAAAHELRCALPDLASAQHEARQFSYDYGDVHIAKAAFDDGEPYYSIYACELRDVPGAGADCLSLTAERCWPIPIL